MLKMMRSEQDNLVSINLFRNKFNSEEPSVQDQQQNQLYGKWNWIWNRVAKWFLVHVHSSPAGYFVRSFIHLRQNEPFWDIAVISIIK